MAARITIELEHAEALVLWALLERIDDRFGVDNDSTVEVSITDMAEMMALWGAKAQLDLQLVEMFDPNYSGLLASAELELRDKSGVWASEH